MAGLFLALLPAEAVRAAGDELALPDKVILKEGVEAPYFATDREIDCLILEETGEKIVLSTSRKKGVDERHEIARSLVEKVVKGDASARSFDLIRGRLALPSDSLNEGFYLKTINEVFEPFLQQYPDSQHRAEVEKAMKAFQEESARVRAGDVRVGNAWYDAEGYRKARLDILAQQCLVRLKEATVERRAEQFFSLLPEIPKYKGSRFYPDLVEAALKAIPKMEDLIKPDLFKDSADRDIAFLDMEIQRQTAIVSAIVNQEAPGHSDNWKKDSNLVYVEEAKSWYDRREIGTDFKQYFTDSQRPRIKLSPANKERVEQYIAQINEDKKARDEVQKSLSKIDSTVAKKQQVLDLADKTYSTIDVERLRRVQKETELLRQEIAQPMPNVPSYALYEKVLQDAGKKPSAAPARLRASQIKDLVESVDNADTRRETLVRVMGNGAEVLNAFSKKQALLAENAKIWPENYEILEMKKTFEAMGTAMPSVTSNAYDTVGDLPFSQTDQVYNGWLKNRKVEAGTIMDLVEIDVLAASAAIKEGDSWKATDIIERIRATTPSSPALKTISAEAYARLNAYLEEGKPQEAKRMLSVMRAAWKGNADLDEADSKFTWIHFWGYSSYLSKSGFMAYAVGYFLVGIFLIGFLTGVVIKVLRRLRR